MKRRKNKLFILYQACTCSEQLCCSELYYDSHLFSGWNAPEMIDAFLSLGHTYVRVNNDILCEKISKSKCVLLFKMKVIVLTFLLLTYIGMDFDIL